jgi:hypothetical protein
MKIEGNDNLLALRRRGAYWWEPKPAPNGRVVPLKIVERSARSTVEGQRRVVEASVESQHR